MFFAMLDKLGRLVIFEFIENDGAPSRPVHSLGGKLFATRAERYSG